MPNFIALGQTTYEKSVAKNFYALQYFGAPRGTPVPQFTYLGDGVQQGPLYQAAKFRPGSENPSTRYMLPKFADFVDGVTDGHT